jgi:hypothetical protein
MRQIGHVHCADEFFIMAEMPIPEDHYYNNYDQIENGIGMVRKMWENWKYVKKKFLRFLGSREGSPVFVTSVSGIQALNPILKEIQRSLELPPPPPSVECGVWSVELPPSPPSVECDGCRMGGRTPHSTLHISHLEGGERTPHLKAVVVKNHLFGEEVTVTGLLSWQDIKAQLVLKDDEYPVFSSAVFNHEMRTLDDVHVEDIKKELDKKVVIVNELFTEWEEI